MNDVRISMLANYLSTFYKTNHATIMVITAGERSLGVVRRPDMNNEITCMTTAHKQKHIFAISVSETKTKSYFYNHEY